MFIEMVCSCEAALHLDAEGADDSVWFLVFRFANAHVSCGYMTEAVSEEARPESRPDEPRPAKKRLIKPRREDTDEGP